MRANVLVFRQNPDSLTKSAKSRNFTSIGHVISNNISNLIKLKQVAKKNSNNCCVS